MFYLTLNFFQMLAKPLNLQDRSAETFEKQTAPGREWEEGGAGCVAGMEPVGKLPPFCLKPTRQTLTLLETS